MLIVEHYDSPEQGETPSTLKYIWFLYQFPESEQCSKTQKNDKKTEMNLFDFLNHLVRHVCLNEASCV